ncbi:MAG: protein kinase domain-containing protein [Planctomycetales bacterium]
MPSSSSHSASTAQSAALAELVEQMADHLAAGRQGQIEALFAQHPKHAARLQQLLPAMSLLAVTGRSGTARTPCAEVTNGSSETIAGTLGDFRILREIGRGGMGVVYEADQISLSRRVALKVLPFAGMLDPRQLQRFSNEAKAAAGLHHQNIVPVYAVGSDRGVHFYAMQLISGRTLAEVVAKLRVFPPLSKGGQGGSLAERTDLSHPGCAFATSPVAQQTTADERPDNNWCRTVALWGAQIAEALEYAHRVGIVHRDIKPANLMLDDEGKVWVADFGLAQMEADAGLTMTGGIVGTLRYMSPEQATGERGLVDQRTDVYSLGATLYELLTLKPAFSAVDRQGLMRQVIDHEPTRPRLFNPSLPTDLETIVLKAMQKDAPQRYATAGALADDLRRFLADRPIAARRPGSVERSVRYCRRHVRWVAAAAVVFVVALVGLATGAVLVFNERNKTAFERQLREQQEQVVRDSQTTSRLNRYVLNFALAGQAWENSQVSLAKEHLALCIPAKGEEDHRGIEWRYLWRLVHSIPAPFARHDGPVIHVCFSPDGKLLATGGADGVRIWDYQLGKQVAWLREHVPAVTRMRFSPDGATLVTTGLDHTALIWDTASWKVQRTIRMREIVTGAEFTPDGRRVVVVEAVPNSNDNRLDSSSCRLTCIETSAWAVDWTLDDLPFVRGGAFAPDGAMLTLTCADCLRSFALSPSPDHLLDHRVAYANDVTFSPVAPLLVANSGEKMVIVYLPLEDRRSDDLLPGHRGQVESVSFAQDGRLLSASRDRTARVWEFRPGRVDRPISTRILRHDAIVWSARFAPDGESVVTGTESGAIYRWSLPVQFECRQVLDAPQNPHLAWFASDGDRLMIAEVLKKGQEEVIVRDSRTGKELSRLDGTAAVMALNRDTCRSYRSEFDGRRVRIFETATGKLEFDLAATGNPVFSPDCRFAAFGPGSNSVRIWNCRDWTESFAFAVTPGMITDLAWSPDGRTLAIASDRGTVKLWNVATGRELLTLVDDLAYVFSVAFSSDGRFLAAGGQTRFEQGDLRIWHMDDAAPVPQDMIQPAGQIGSGNPDAP